MGPSAQCWHTRTASSLYGSERGSILLDVGGRIRNNRDSTPSSAGASSPSSAHRHRTRRPRHSGGSGVASSPLRSALEPPPMTPPPPITPIDEAVEDQESSESGSDDPAAPLLNRALLNVGNAPRGGGARWFNIAVTVAHHVCQVVQRRRCAQPIYQSAAPFILIPHSFRHLHGSSPFRTLRPSPPPPDSPMSPNANPPTPGYRDIHLQALTPGHRRAGSTSSSSTPAPPADGSVGRRRSPCTALPGALAAWQSASEAGPSSVLPSRRIYLRGRRPHRFARRGHRCCA